VNSNLGLLSVSRLQHARCHLAEQLNPRARHLQGSANTIKGRDVVQGLRDFRVYCHVILISSAAPPALLILHKLPLGAPMSPQVFRELFKCDVSTTRLFNVTVDMKIMIMGKEVVLTTNMAE
jgi:hypothetical protein